MAERLDVRFKRGETLTIDLFVADPQILDLYDPVRIEWRIVTFDKLMLILLEVRTTADTDIIEITDPVAKKCRFTLTPVTQDEILLPADGLFYHEGFVEKGECLFPFDGTMHVKETLKYEFPTQDVA